MSSSNQHRLTIYIFSRPLIGRKELLLLRRVAGSHRFPGYEEVVGGRVNDGEAERDAALREPREEIGLSGFLPGLLLRHFRDYAYGNHKVNHVYYLVMWWKPSIDISQNPDHEHDHYAWRSFREITQLAYRHLEILHELLNALHWA